jgi:prepilin-type N-terminal cleavage/methylation domain-containing protein
MRRFSPRARSGFTLLELMLALLIAVMIMAALYGAMDAQLRSMEESRARIEKSTVSRALFARITSDLASAVAPTVPVISSSTTVALVVGGGGAAAATPTPAQSSSTTTTKSFQIGVQGDNNSK